MAYPTFTFADNFRLGLQIAGAAPCGTAEVPLGFKRLAYDSERKTQSEITYIGQGVVATRLGIAGGFYFKGDGSLVASIAAGVPIFGVYFSDKNGDYIQTGGVAYVQTSEALTTGSKIYVNATTGKVSKTSSGNIEIIGGVAADPTGKITVSLDGTSTDFYPIYLNNCHL